MTQLLRLQRTFGEQLIELAVTDVEVEASSRDAEEATAGTACGNGCVLHGTHLHEIGRAMPRMAIAKMGTGRRGPVEKHLSHTTPACWDFCWDA